MASAWANRGGVYLSKGDKSRAIADCREAVRLNPDMPEAYNIRAEAYLLYPWSTDKALDDLNMAIQLRPDFVRAYYNRACVYGHYSNLTEFEKAMEDFNKAISLEPGYAAAYRDRGKLCAMSARKDEKSKDEKISLFDRALADYVKAEELGLFVYSDIQKVKEEKKTLTRGLLGKVGKALWDFI
jgi:tetratricopeptide (TPR) repeat protein